MQALALICTYVTLSTISHKHTHDKNAIFQRRKNCLILF